MAGDVLLYPGHVGFYDPTPPIAGDTLYSATSHGVRNENPKYWPPQTGVYRFQITNEQ
jgi:hypothetical protein